MRRIKPELAVCLGLIALAILSWVGFLATFRESFSQRAAFAFMRSHLKLGESPAFVLSIAGEGIPQPFDVLFYQIEFWVSLLLLALFVSGLSWLVIRTRRISDA